MRLSREDRNLLSEWWFTVDKPILALVLALMAFGLLGSLSASPAVAVRLGHDPLYFFHRHLIFLVPSILLLFLVSFLSPNHLRQFGLVIMIGSLALMIVVLFTGLEVNGSKRWIRLFGLSLQPSEFAKPSFIVLSAWAFSQWIARKDMPGLPIAIAILLVYTLLMLQQPDIGQSILFAAVWTGLFFLSGTSLLWIAIIALIGLIGFGIAIVRFPHVADRIGLFWNSGSGDRFQLDRALQSFVDGGWFGRGLGEGQLKQNFPDAHTDFIFAVIAEEYGIVACLVILGLVTAIVIRGILTAARHPDHFVRLAALGMTFLFGLQAAINMLVNVGLLPAKGMTLPFVSYGGSSLLAMSLTIGILLGLSRHRAPKQNIGPTISMSTLNRDRHRGGMRI